MNLIPSVLDPGGGQPQVELLSLPALERGPARHVLVIPGNPGSAGFYGPFMRSLFTLLHQRVNVVALSFPGHDVGRLSSRFLSLQETIALVERVLASFPAGEPVAVVGHSIGAYMALQAMRKADPTSIIALLPFLQFDESSRSQRIMRWALGRIPLFRALMAAVRWVLRDDVKRRMARRRVHHSEGVESALRLLSDRSLTAMWTLARHEFSDLSVPLRDALPLARSQHKTSVFYTPGDRWFPPPHRHSVESALGAENVFELTAVQHAFCISPEQSHRVAVQVVKRLQATWVGAQG